MKRLALLAATLALFILPQSVLLAATTSMPARPVRILCDALSTTNITRSGPQTLDVVALVAGKVACVVGESDNKNGAYIVQASTWKAVDPGLGTGLELYALAGSANANKVYGADTTGAVIWGTTSVTFTLKSSTGSAFNPAAPGPIGGTTPAAITSTTDTTANGVLITSAGSTPTTTSGQVAIGSMPDSSGVIIKNQYGGVYQVGNIATTATANVRQDVRPFTLANDATFDYAPSSGGTMLVVVPGASTCPMAHIGFAANGVTTLNGVTPAGGITLTLGNATTLNIAASGGNVRFENKTGVSITVLMIAFKFGAS